MYEFTVHDVERNEKGFELHLASGVLGKSEFRAPKKLNGWTRAEQSPGLIKHYSSAPMAEAFGLSYGQHHSLKLTPDTVWLCLLRGVSAHIDCDPEGLRHHFVEHEGQEHIELGGAIMPEGPNSWTPWFGRFKEALQERIDKKAELITCNFSTTTERDLVASQILLMASMKHYFTYGMMLACGHPTIRLEGTPDDWADMIDRARALSEFDLKWWTDALIPILEEFERTAQGKPDVDFWGRGYLAKRFGSGGQQMINGWMNVLYPYVGSEQDWRTGKADKPFRRNPALAWEKKGSVDFKALPGGLVSAPVECNNYGDIYQLEFTAGLSGVTYLDGYVQPCSGWFVQDVTEEKANTD